MALTEHIRKSPKVGEEWWKVKEKGGGLAVSLTMRTLKIGGRFCGDK